MDRLGFFIGLVGLAISLFPDAISSDHRNLLFWLGIICLIWGGLALLRAYRGFFKLAWNALNGRFALLSFLEMEQERSPGRGASELLDRVINLARSGQATIYGERGRAKRLVAIQPGYFETHDVVWFGPSVYTVDPRKDIREQDTDDQFFNLHAGRSVARMLH